MSVTATIPHAASFAASLKAWMSLPAARYQCGRRLEFLLPLTGDVVGHVCATFVKIDRQDFAPMPHVEMARAWQPCDAQAFNSVLFGSHQTDRNGNGPWFLLATKPIGRVPTLVHRKSRRHLRHLDEVTLPVAWRVADDLRLPGKTLD